MKEENAEENHGIFQRLTERLLEKSVGLKAAGPSGVWNDLKSKMSDGVSGLASKIQTVGDRIVRPLLTRPILCLSYFSA